ncbi:hypothetical protein M885DRAFT_566720 [Pelagophyceae sp. CCMP2097]|nr:hypothetical protein M885DRAFT_566720 [Pelagophyceae sp. CCMP2097]
MPGARARRGASLFPLDVDAARVRLPAALFLGRSGGPLRGFKIDESDPFVGVARWQRRRRREAPHEDAAPSSVGAVLRSVPAARPFVQGHVSKLRRSVPAAQRDAFLGRWLEAEALTHEPDAAEHLRALEEASGLLARALASKHFDASDDSSRRAGVRTAFLCEAAKQRKHCLNDKGRDDKGRDDKGRAVRPVVRLDASAGVQDVRGLLKEGVPCIITNGADAVAGGRRASWSLAELAERMPPNASAALKRWSPTARGWASLDAAAVQTNVKAFLATVAADAAPDAADYLHDWSLPLHAPSLLDCFFVPRWLQGDVLSKGSSHMYSNSWPSLFVGARGTRSATHVDAAASHFAMALIAGEKEWLVWPSAEAGLLYPFYGDGSMDVLFEADAQIPDAVRHPASLRATPWAATLCPGDLILVPSNCPHFVTNVGKTVAVAMNFVDSTNLDAARTALSAVATPDALHLAGILRGAGADDVADDVADDAEPLPWQAFKDALPRGFAGDDSPTRKRPRPADGADCKQSP